MLSVDRAVDRIDVDRQILTESCLDHWIKSAAKADLFKLAKYMSSELA